MVSMQPLDASHSTTTEIWRGDTHIRFYWCKDEFGRPNNTLYLGRIYVGSIMHWANERRAVTPYRAWFMSDSDGDEIGWFATHQEAMDALIDRALKDMQNVPD